MVGAPGFESGTLTDPKREISGRAAQQPDGNEAGTGPQTLNRPQVKDVKGRGAQNGPFSAPQTALLSLPKPTHVQASLAMARPGIEAGTPRFSEGLENPWLSAELREPRAIRLQGLQGNAVPKGQLATNWKSAPDSQPFWALRDASERIHGETHLRRGWDLFRSLLGRGQLGPASIEAHPPVFFLALWP
jgi:hypothetical protein